MSDWQPTTWSYEHPEYGYFFVSTCAEGALATHVHEHIVCTIPAAGAEPLHRSVSAAMLACERHLEALERAERVPALRLVAP